MAKIYLDRIKDLLSPLIDGKVKSVEFEFKHFFSGAALYVNGNISMTLTPVGFALKLPEQIRESLIKDKSAKTLRYFPKAPIKKDYVILSEKVMADKATLEELVEVCINYVKDS